VEINMEKINKKIAFGEVKRGEINMEKKKKKKKKKFIK